MVDLHLLRVIRLHIVVGGFLGYSVGVLFSLNLGGDISWFMFFLGYLVVLFEDLSTHFNNDYFDVEVDKSAPFKPFGNVNQFIKHPKLMDSALHISVTFSILSLLISLYLVYNGVVWYLLVFVVLFNVLGWIYSAPPVRLHSRRLGEITIAIGTGLCIPAVGYFLAQGGVDNIFTVFSVPLILYGFVLSLCLQIPDYEVDLSMNKKTIVGLIGRRKTYFLVFCCAVAATVTYFFLFPNVTTYFKIVPWVSLIPIVASLYSILFLSESPEHSKLFTKVNVSALFMFLAGLNLVLLMGSGLLGL